MKGVESLGCRSEPKSELDRIFCVHTQSFLKGAKIATTIYCVISTVFNTLYAVAVF